MENIMIKIDGVKKQYKLGQIGGTTLRDELQRLNAKIHHKEDPTRRIGAKDYNKGETFMALDGVSFEVKRGERVGIIGHNGAGKSTLLKLLSRVTAPTDGTIGLNGRVASMLEVGTGFHPELTGRENIYMNGAILGMTKKEIDAKIEDIIDFSECRQFIDTPVKRYSSGMYVKLAFSVAAHLNSEILIMDEVLAVGDMAFQKKCLDKMNDVSRQDGRTILYVSHNMNTIRQLCDRVIVLDHGKVVFDGDVEDGIAVYMGNEKTLRSQYYFDKERILEYNSDWNVHFFSATVLDKQVAVFDDNEPIQFALKCDSKKELQNIFIRFVIYSFDGQAVAMATTRKKMILKQGENTILLRFDHSTLAPGDYWINLIAYSTCGNKLEQLHDVIEKAITFKITTEKGANSLEWKHKFWGYSMLPEIEVLQNDHD